MEDEILEAFESFELRSLRWGFADGSFSETEALEIITNTLQTRADPEVTLDALVRGRLLVEVWAPGDQRRLRSRFAETVRLLSRLRQIFPSTPWTNAPRLVSDFRVDIRRRSYPSRDLPASEVFWRIAGNTATPLRTQIWEALSGADLLLADFQEEAAQRLLHSSGDLGLIVTAGTGSGKTMAFYLPALTRIAELVRVNENWTKALAVYPRTELLKDQFAETYRMARRLDGVQVAPRRPIKIGAYFSSTPGYPDPADVKSRGWTRRGGSFVCPWLPCTVCGGDLIWSEADLAARRERLTCVNPRCASEIDENEIVLTRQRLRREPPDLLFTTTEMLNQRLSDLDARRMFGVGQPSDRRPLFALLDEVHTYTGTAGAQAALTLRRWRHAVNAPVTFVGLSATLRQATQFFADLVGLDPSLVEEASPTTFVKEGAEYQVLLRSDPASRSSVLSTSIQSAMLLSRMLDPLENGRSGGRFGSRLFAFTDNLDVINRLFDNLRDAEGLDIFGRPRVGTQPLAALRRPLPTAADFARRELDGQNWRVSEDIGRRLDQPLLVGRTTSEDAGVLGNADVVVATASLEVGYNDARVGAVLQHKAPKDAASFLQRRGRAGRSRGMRPLTVTVLSDYGRDRVAFQAYEHLFDPVLPAQPLPIQNEYVLRMQATYALFDWIADQAGQQGRGWAWDVLSRPQGDRAMASDALREVAKQKLLDLSRGEPTAIASLTQHLRRALKIDQPTVETLLWQPPRSLLLDAIPTLSRRLHRNWRLAHPLHDGMLDLHTEWHPLPDFVARNLFSDLNLPEVTVVLPPATVQLDEKQRGMPIAAALTQLAPGRVTRRFAVERGGLHHWSPLEPDIDDQALLVSQYAELSEHIGDFATPEGAVHVYRPWRVRLQAPARHIAGPTSNGSFVWRSEFVPQGDPLSIDPSPRSPWRRHVSKISFYLHRHRSNIGVRRFATGGEAILRRQSGDRRIRYRFIDDEGATAAIGFEIEVDALSLQLNLDPVLQRAALTLPTDILAGCRSAYFRHLILHDPEMPSDVDPFQREWLHQILLSAALVDSVDQHVDLSAAAVSILDQPDAVDRLRLAMAVIFQNQAVTDLDGEDGGPDEAPTTHADGHLSGQEQALTDVMHRDEVLQRLRTLSEQASEPEPSAFQAWMVETVIATLTEAVLQACAAMAPRHISADSLVADTEPTASPTIWVSETTLGGAGVLQAIAERAAEEPRLLARAMEGALAPTDLEIAANGLEAFVELVHTDREVRAAVALLRSASGHAEREGLRARLYQLLTTRGLDVGHALSVSLNARLLTPTNGPELDGLLHDLLGRWRDLETRIGVAVGVREIAHVFGVDPNVRARLRIVVGSAHELDHAEAAQLLANVLWPRGVETSQRALQSYSPYAARRHADPRLARALLERSGRRVSLVDVEWRARVGEALAEEGSAELFAPAAAAADFRTALLEVLLDPVDVGFLQFFPRVERVESHPAGWVATLIVQEQV